MMLRMLVVAAVLISTSYVYAGPACIACSVPCAVGPNPACIMCVVTLCPMVCLSSSSYVSRLHVNNTVETIPIEDVRVGFVVRAVDDESRPTWTRVAGNVGVDSKHGFSFVKIVTDRRNVTVTPDHVVIQLIHGRAIATLAGQLRVGDTLLGVSDGPESLLVRDLLPLIRHRRFTLSTEIGTVAVNDHGGDGMTAVTTMCRHGALLGRPLMESIGEWRKFHAMKRYYGAAGLK